MPDTSSLPITRQAAIEALGGNEALFKRCEKAGWIKKIAGLYEITEVQGAWARLRQGEEPKAKKP
jgi:hypothetical protein